jgi:hypothetical protein
LGWLLRSSQAPIYRELFVRCGVREVMAVVNEEWPEGEGNWSGAEMFRERVKLLQHAMARFAPLLNPPE